MTHWLEKRYRFEKERMKQGRFYPASHATLPVREPIGFGFLPDSGVFFEADNLFETCRQELVLEGLLPGKLLQSDNQSLRNIPDTGG